MPCCAALIAACHVEPHERAPRARRGHDGDALRIAIEAMPARLDPRFALDAYASQVGSLVFASLARMGADGRHLPYLATAWRCDDGLECTFTLRSDMRFHDGRPVTAADVKATYDALLDPALGSPRRATLESIASVQAPAPGRVTFRLHRPDAAFMEATLLAVLPADLAGRRHLAVDELVGSGPYRLAAVRDDELVRLEAFTGFAPFEPAIATIELRVVPDGMMRALELVAGEIDLVQNAVDPDTTDWLARRGAGLDVLRGPSSNFQYLGMNLEHPALSDVLVRRAIAHAIDREAIVEHLLQGQAVAASGLLPPGHWAFTGRLRDHPYDPARARRLLDRAGLHDPDGAGPAPRLTLSYKTTTAELRRRIAEAIASQLDEVGIRLEVLSYEWGTFFADVRGGNFHLYSLQWVGITDPDIFRQVFHTAMIPPAGNNRGRFRDARMDRLTERGRATLDRERRARIYRRVQRLAARRLPYIPLWWPDRIVIATAALEGFEPHPGGDLFGLALGRLGGGRDRERSRTGGGTVAADEISERQRVEGLVARGADRAEQLANAAVEGGRLAGLGCWDASTQDVEHTGHRDTVRSD